MIYFYNNISIVVSRNNVNFNKSKNEKTDLIRLFENRLFIFFVKIT
jgi:hypothetical protein